MLILSPWFYLFVPFCWHLLLAAVQWYVDNGGGIWENSFAHGITVCSCERLDVFLNRGCHLYVHPQCNLFWVVGI